MDIIRADDMQPGSVGEFIVEMAHSVMAAVLLATKGDPAISRAILCTAYIHVVARTATYDEAMATVKDLEDTMHEGYYLMNKNAKRPRPKGLGVDE